MNSRRRISHASEPLHGQQATAAWGPWERVASRQGATSLDLFCSAGAVATCENKWMGRVVGGTPWDCVNWIIRLNSQSPSMAASRSPDLGSTTENPKAAGTSIVIG